MQYTDFPPCPYFLQVLRHFPEAALLYYKLWGSRNSQHKLAIKKEDIPNIFLVSPTVFRNRIVNLMEEGLLSFETTPKFYYIEFVPFDEVLDDDEKYEFT